MHGPNEDYILYLERLLDEKEEIISRAHVLSHNVLLDVRRWEIGRFDTSDGVTVSDILEGFKITTKGHVLDC